MILEFILGQITRAIQKHILGKDIVENPNAEILIKMVHRGGMEIPILMFSSKHRLGFFA